MERGGYKRHAYLWKALTTQPGQMNKEVLTQFLTSNVVGFAYAWPP